MEYLGYEQSRGQPNVVVDGSPNESTVLSLTHWPGMTQPQGLAGDLSAGMVFGYLDRHGGSYDAEVVTNNHFDQDGLVSIYAMIQSEEALKHRDLLIDVAAAGDFATYDDRRAARASMIISRHAEVDDSTGEAKSTDRLYIETLPQLLSFVLDPDRFRDLWADEDSELTTSEALINRGTVTIDERADVDLAIVTIPEQQGSLGGHRFGGMWFDGLHPMAINNATNRFRLLVVHGRRYQYTDRYETWVQYVSRRPLPRVDLRPIATALNEIETRAAAWEAQRPGALTPQLGHSDESSLNADQVVDLICHHLRTDPPAWDPYTPSPL